MKSRTWELCKSWWGNSRTVESKRAKSMWGNLVNYMWKILGTDVQALEHESQEHMCNFEYYVKVLAFVCICLWYIWHWQVVDKLLASSWIADRVSMSHTGNEVISIWGMNSNLRIAETYKMMEMTRSRECTRYDEYHNFLIVCMCECSIYQEKENLTYEANN